MTSIVNAYDDGSSTGRIRAFVPGMLGPSDIRKNISTFMPTAERCQRALKRLLDYRFPDGTTRAQALADLQPLASASGSFHDPILAGAFVQLTNGQLTRLGLYAKAFLDHEAAQPDRCPYRRPFEADFVECAAFQLTSFIAADSRNKPAASAERRELAGRGGGAPRHIK